jgi:hypothetical protein
LSWNPNVTFDHVLAYPDKPWDWDGLSVNPNITFDHVLAYPDKPWDWDGLSENQNFLEISDTIYDVHVKKDI